MPRRKNGRRLKRIFSVLAVLTAIPVSIKLMMLSVPYMNAAATKAALLSAGINLPGSGQAALADVGTSSLASASSDISSAAVSSAKEAVSSQQASSQNTISVISVPSQITESAVQVAAANRGTILRQTYNGGYAGDLIQQVKGGIRNSTTIATATVQKELEKKLDFSLTKTTQPQVLIYHTHATESYEPVTRDYYDKSFNSRTRDNTKNMIMVGNQIEAQLQKAGIGVIHDTTQHDYPSYTGAYELSTKTIQKHLKEHPTINVLLDVHRDAIQRQNGDRIAPVAKINGKNAAQIMIVSGAEQQGNITHDFYKNLRFAAHLQKQMETDNPGLMRPVSFIYRKYNQSASPGALLLEVGGHGNSLEEARYAGELAGASIAKALLKMQS